MIKVKYIATIGSSIKMVIKMSKADFCGLDFGTSNSTIGIVKAGQVQMVPLEQGKPTLRSAIFFDYTSHKCVFGSPGISEYLDHGHGRLMMSLKSILGSSLMEEKTFIDQKWVSYIDILERLIRHIKNTAEEFVGHSLTKAVMGRPVRFHDTDDKRDKLAQKTLQEVAHRAGFDTVQFQFEPIAAALAYEQTISKEQIALIVDLGGGTADFSVIRLRPQDNKQQNKQHARQHNRQQDVLANQGVHIGGTDFDTKFSLGLVMPHLGLGGRMRSLSGTIEIPNSFYHDLTTWHTINGLYTHKIERAITEIYHHALEPKLIKRLKKVIEKQQGHKIIDIVERAKCYLSENNNTILDLNFIEENFSVNVTKIQFETFIHDEVEKLMHTLQDTVVSSGLKPHEIDSIFFTGGSTQIPLIRQKIQNAFPSANIVQGDVFSSVGKGLILDATHHFQDAATRF